MLYEKNTIIKHHKHIDVHFGLCYPNIYQTAMSSLGYNILYNQINEREDTWCERIIYPNEKSIESNTPSKYFDILSFTLQFEEDYFNVLELLKKSDIPLKRKDRGDNDPLIIAGGPSPTANPKPLSDYIDIFIIGEGENTINEFIEEYKHSKKDLENYLKIPGVYIPKFDNKCKISLVNDMNNAYHITEPIISKSDDGDYHTIFNNTIMLNVSRGCTLIGAAVSDYSQLTELTTNLEKEGFQISTPSLRIESITYDTLKTLKRSGLKTITLAPESISKLRKVINKDLLDEKIFTVIQNAIDLDFKIKLYFLIGIPGESLDDINELVEYMKKIANMHYSIRNVKFSVNPLIPKPHTPLQWEPYDFKDIKNKTRYIQREMKNYNIKCESPKKGLIQYILSCGNSDIGGLIEKSLTKKPTLKEWKEKIPKYDIDDELPWHNIDVGINERFLKIENRRLKNLKQTPWCETSPCYNCGSCEK